MASPTPATALVEVPCMAGIPLTRLFVYRVCCLSCRCRCVQRHFDVAYR